MPVEEAPGIGLEEFPHDPAGTGLLKSPAGALHQCLCILEAPGVLQPGLEPFAVAGDDFLLVGFVEEVVSTFIKKFVKHGSSSRVFKGMTASQE